MNDKKVQIEFPGPEKTGAFIKFLRVSHNLTQEELGDMIYVTRKAVSKWENGICYPSIDLIPRIADLFGISLEEILAGEFKTEDDSNLNTLKYIIKAFKNKHIKNVIISIIIVSVFCLLTFFFENYNATKIYDVFYEDDSIYIKNGIIISTRSKQYFNFGVIKFENNEVTSDTLIKYRLYLRANNDKKEETLASYSMKNNPYYRGTDYKELTTNNLTNHLNEIMLNIQYVDNLGNKINKDIKLQVKLKYKSNDLYQFKKTSDSFFDTKYVYDKLMLKNILNPYYTKNIINISYIIKLSEEEKSKRYNKSIKELNIKYKNDYLIISDMNYELIIDFGTLTYFIRDLKNKSIDKTIREIEEGKISLNNFIDNKTAVFINKVYNYFLYDMNL